MGKRKYRTYKDKEYLGEFYAEELHKKLGIAPTTVYAYAGNGYAYEGVYTFQKKTVKAIHKKTLKSCSNGTNGGKF